MALLARCADAGIAPVVAAPMEGVFLDRLRTAGYEVAVVEQPARLNRYGGALYRDGPAARWRSATDAIGYIARVRRWLRRQRFDALYCNDMRGLLTFGVAARTLGVPVLTWDKLDKPHGWLDHLQLPLTTRNLVIAEKVKDKYPKFQKFFFSYKIKKITNGIDLSLSKEITIKNTDSNCSDFRVVIAIIGSVTPRKGHQFLFEAFDKVIRDYPYIELWVVGAPQSQEDVVFQNELKSYFISISEKIQWLGYRKDVFKLMSSIDVVVVPSLNEGIPSVMLEAMICEIPVIASSITGTAEAIVDGENGLLVDPRDTKALSEAMNRLVNEPDTRTNFGRKARQHVVRHFDLNKQLMMVLDEIRDVR